MHVRQSRAVTEPCYHPSGESPTYALLDDTYTPQHARSRYRTQLATMSFDSMKNMVHHSAEILFCSCFYTNRSYCPVIPAPRVLCRAWPSCRFSEVRRAGSQAARGDRHAGASGGSPREHERLQLKDCQVPRPRRGGSNAWHGANTISSICLIDTHPVFTPFSLDLPTPPPIFTPP